MRIAYLDCFAGIAGDMFLGALVGAGVPADVLHHATAALNLNATLKIETVNRSGISATKVHVLEGEYLAEARQPTHTHPTEAAPEITSIQHPHKTESSITHPHQHPHDHHHGRSLADIRTLIATAKLDDAVKDLALRTFHLLGHAEAKVHNVPLDRIHFHEVGAVDSIVDIVAASAGIHHLQIAAWHASPVNVGSGTVECAHGTFPVPAPATAELLRGLPTYSAHVQHELATPTGAALLRALDPSFGEQPRMRINTIGYGAGTRNPKNFPATLRLSVGETLEADSATTHDADTVTVLETALDDLSPQLIAYVAEKALAAGALDVMLTPVIMKKGRPGTLLTVLCRPTDSSLFEHLLLTETSTLGVRIRHDRRICLDRRHLSIETPFGPIRMKIGLQGGDERNAAPEFEDCRTAAAQHNVPLKQVQQAAIAAYLHRA
jgi:hypothetical protein